jgi:hypothetical protein
LQTLTSANANAKRRKSREVEESTDGFFGVLAFLAGREPADGLRVAGRLPKKKRSSGNVETRRLTAFRKNVKTLKNAYFWNADSTGTPRQACGRGAPSAQAIVAATSK